MVTMRPPSARRTPRATTATGRHVTAWLPAIAVPRLARRARPGSRPPPSSCVPRRMRWWTWCRSTRSPTSSRRGSPLPATGSTWSAAASATRCSDREQTDLDFTTDARPPAVLALLEGWAEAVWDTGIAFGTVGARRRGMTVEITTFRADAYDRVSRNPVVAFGETIEDDLVRRDFTVNAMAVELTGGDGAPAVRRPARRPRRAGRRHARHAGDARGVVRRRPAADAARRAVRLPARPHPGAAGGRGDDGDGRRAGADHPGAGAGRAHQADPRPAPAPRARAAGRHGARRPRAARGPRRCGWPSTSTCSTRTSTRTRWWCSSRRSSGRPTARTSCCGWPRCCTTSASPRPGARSRTAGSASTTTRWSGRS